MASFGPQVKNMAQAGAGGVKKGSLCGRGSTGVSILPFPSVSPNLQPPGPSPFRTFPLRHLPIQSHRSQRLPPLRRFTATPFPLPRPAYGEGSFWLR